VERVTLSLVRKAKEGDKEALMAVIRNIQDRVFGLAIRMLWHPADAEDATQEILFKIITHLGSFREESSFDTWVYRVACNHLLTTKAKHVKRKEVGLEQSLEKIEHDAAAKWPVSQAPAEQALMVEEAMLTCIRIMLHCLSPDLRMAFILGEIFQISGSDAAEALELTPATFRKRLSRARSTLQAAMKDNCSLINPNNPCSCEQQATKAVKEGKIKPEKLRRATQYRRLDKKTLPLNKLHALDELQRVAAVFRSMPDYAAPEKLGQGVEEFIDSVESWLLEQRP
jgi:RNA polymerase sigma factor (sigma-70 family)